MSGCDQICSSVVFIDKAAVEDFRKRNRIRQEALIIQEWSGPDIYSNFLLKYGRRPEPETAGAMGKLLGGQVRDCNGRLQPKASTGRPGTRTKARNVIDLPCRKTSLIADKTS